MVAILTVSSSVLFERLNDMALVESFKKYLVLSKHSKMSYYDYNLQNKQCYFHFKKGNMTSLHIVDLFLNI